MKTKARKMWMNDSGGITEGRSMMQHKPVLVLPADKASVAAMRERIMEALVHRFRKASGLPTTPDRWAGEADAVLRAIGLKARKPDRQRTEGGT